MGILNGRSPSPEITLTPPKNLACFGLQADTLSLAAEIQETESGDYSAQLLYRDLRLRPNKETNKREATSTSGIGESWPRIELD